MTTWEEVGLGQVPSEIVKVGLGLVPLTDGRHWYARQGERYLRTGMGHYMSSLMLRPATQGFSTGLGDLSNSDLLSAAQAIVNSPPGAGVNSAVSSFQSLYNSNGGSPSIATDGEYGPCTVSAVQAVLNTAVSGGSGAAQQAPASAYAGTCSNGAYVAPASGSNTSGMPVQSGQPSPMNTTGMLMWGAVGGAGGGLLGYFISHAFRGKKMHIRAYTAVGALAGAGVGGYFGSQS